MYKFPVKSLITLFVVGVVLCYAGCGSQPSVPANQTANTNVAVAPANSDSPKTAPAAMAAESECDEPNIETRKGKVHDKIVEKIKDKNSPKGLREQYESGAFTVMTEVHRPDPLWKGYLVVYVAGMVHGSDGLKDLANILNDFHKEKGGCVSRVAFVSRQALRDGSYRRNDPGLEWTYCPFDSKPCSDGTCGCKRKKPYNSAPLWEEPDTQ